MVFDFGQILNFKFWPKPSHKFNLYETRKRHDLPMFTFAGDICNLHPKRRKFAQKLKNLVEYFHFLQISLICQNLRVYAGRPPFWVSLMRLQPYSVLHRLLMKIRIYCQILIASHLICKFWRIRERHKVYSTWKARIAKNWHSEIYICKWGDKPK